MKIEIIRGDLFATRNPMLLGRGINLFQRIWSHDNKSEYSHTGFLRDSAGTTFESNWHIESQNLFKAYKGKNVLIARNIKMTPEAYKNGWDAVKHLEGKLYPVWRLAFHIIPVFAKYINIFKKPVCSELDAWFLYAGGLRHSQYMGTNVDTLVDEWKNYSNYRIIYMGVLPDNND